ncbi:MULTISPECIES: LTA synthase family protein [Sediminibacillus]|uniref:LTA synthase family protein n=1 Tax=Sediminibacillus TaxID=482460 RepID=UPI00041E7E2C|nr:LTA synthase family protein [Sediminibacillus terrae]
MYKKLFNIPLYIIATVLFGLKTYIVYRFIFEISLDNWMQEFILFVNPFASAFLVFTLSVWFKERRQMKFLRYAALIGTLIIYFNLIFYRNFTDFITIPVLFQGSNAADLGSSIMSLVHIPDLLLFLDVAIIWVLSRKYPSVISAGYHKRGKTLALSVSLLFLLFNYTLAEIERPQLLQRTFDREYLVKNIGLFNYHIYDAVLQSKTKAQRVFADGNEMPEITEYVDEHVQNKEKSDMFGAAKGKNVIFISLESVQNFVINNKVNGEEITPFLNDLIDESYYFENFYHQTEQGKTSDSEFLIENSLYPLSRGAVFFTHGQNEYHASPEILGENGYFTSVFHANNKSFWNRDVMYDSLGYDKFFDVESYEVTEDNSIGWGLKDKPFFEQSMKYLQSQQQPFYSKFITLTNHYPFDLEEEDASIDKYDSNSKTLNQYFPTVRYTDEAVEQFFKDLKESGLYEDSVIVLMGDHYGISEFHNKAMGQYLGREVTPYEHIQLQRVPFFIHIPGEEGGVISEVAGQIDVKPTILSLLGIESDDDITFGTDLFAKDRKEFIALRNGDYISDDYIYTKGQCYDRKTGELLESDPTGLEQQKDDQSEGLCEPVKEKVDKELSYSDKIIYGDLLRFYDFNDEEDDQDEQVEE